MQSALSAACLAALMLAMAPAAAQEAEAEAEPEAEAEAEAEAEPEAEPEPAPPDPAAIEVRVIGDKADSMQKVPGSGMVIRPEELERAQPQDAAEMLRRVPGVNVRQDNGSGGRLDIGVRGLDPGRSRRVLLLEDGIPVGNQPYSEPDMYWSPPPERWEGVEVVKGSGSILFGPQTVGGVVNFITPHVPWRRVARVEAKGGDRGAFQAYGRYGDRHGDVGYLAQFLFNRGDGFRAQAFRTIDSFGKVSFPTSDTGSATVMIGIHDNRSDSDDVGLTSAMYAADARRTTLAPHDEAKTRRYHVSLTHEHQFNDVVSLRTLAYAYALDRIWRRQAYVRFPAGGVRYERIVGDVTVPNGAIYFEPNNIVLDRSYVVAGLEPRLQLRFSTGEVDHTIDVGARVLAEGAHFEQRNGERPTSYAGSLALDERNTTIAGAAYVQDRLGFLDELLLVTPGVRFEYARYGKQLDRQPTADGAEDVDITSHSDVVGIVPGIGMTAGLPDIHGFAGAHVGFAPPRLATSISAAGIPQQVDAETSLTYEAGVRARQPVFQLEAAGFLNNFSNQIVSASVGNVTTLVNGGQTRQLGMESGGVIVFGKLIKHGVLLDLGARYTLMRATFEGGGDNDGNELPYAPNHLANATLDVGHEIGLGGQLSYSYVGPQFVDDLNTVDEDVTGRLGRIPGYHRLDANVRYTEHHTGLTVFASMKDILDRPFIIARRPEGIFASGFRQMIVGLRWDYEEEK